jgi:hypothetical protein
VQVAKAKRKKSDTKGISYLQIGAVDVGVTLHDREKEPRRAAVKNQRALRVLLLMSVG